MTVPRLAGVAQLVEQLIRNQQVTRSSRVAGSKFSNDNPAIPIRLARASVKGNADQSDHSLETVIKVRWYPKHKALEMCARSLGMLKDSVHVAVSEETLDRLDEWKAANLRARQLADTDDGD